MAYVFWEGVFHGVGLVGWLVSFAQSSGLGAAVYIGSETTAVGLAPRRHG